MERKKQSKKASKNERREMSVRSGSFCSIFYTCKCSEVLLLLQDDLLPTNRQVYLEALLLDYDVSLLIGFCSFSKFPH